MFAVIGIILAVVYAILGFRKPRIALVTLPIACFLFLYSAIVATSYTALLEATLLTFVILVVASVAVIASVAEPESRAWPQTAAKLILIAFVVFLLCVTAAAVFAAGLGGLALLVAFVGVIGLLFCGVSYGLTSRHSTAAYVLSTIGASMRQNLPLPMALESAAAGRSDKRARILRKIEKWLVQGYPLSEAIKRGYPRCPGYAIAMIASAQQCNQLPLALRTIETDMAAKASERRKFRPVHPFYPVALMTFMLLMLSALVTGVLPHFAAVLEETVERPELPAATRLLMGTVTFLLYDVRLTVWTIIAVLILLSAAVWVRVRFRPRRPEGPYLVSRVGDFVKWHLPVLHWFERNYSLLQAVELLRLSLNTGCTVNSAIANTLSLDVNNRFKRRLRRWLENVERGDNIAEGARATGLGAALAWAFDDRINQGNTLAILETLESFYRANYSYYVNLARFILWPCVILVMGATVGFVVYAMFSPGVVIIRHFAELAYP